MGLALKPGARVTGLRPETLFAMTVAHGLWTDKGYRICTVTSCCDGKHGNSSKHYIGGAFDLRTRDMTPEQAEMAATELRERLGQEYDVILESDHIHVEHDVKQP